MSIIYTCVYIYICDLLKRDGFQIQRRRAPLVPPRGAGEPCRCCCSLEISLAMRELSGAKASRLSV